MDNGILVFLIKDNPIVYRIDGDDYELISYGEDGRPGGIWFDSDLSNRGPYPPESFPPSLEVYYNSELGMKTIQLSALVGLFCLFCSFWILLEKVPQPRFSRGNLADRGEITIGSAHAEKAAGVYGDRLLRDRGGFCPWDCPLGP